MQKSASNPKSSALKPNLNRLQELQQQFQQQKPTRILLKNKEEFKKIIAPDELYFDQQEKRKVKFNTEIRGIKYAKYEFEYQFYDACEVDEGEEL